MSTTAPPPTHPYDHQNRQLRAAQFRAAVSQIRGKLESLGIRDGDAIEARAARHIWRGIVGLSVAATEMEGRL